MTEGSKDWAARRAKLDMKEVSKRLLTALLWYAFPVHHVKNLNVDSRDGATVRFTAEPLSVYGKHVIKFMAVKMAEAFDADPELSASAAADGGAGEAFNVALQSALEGIYPKNVVAWLTVTAKLDDKSDDIVFDMRGSFKDGWAPEMTHHLLTVLQDFGMERAIQIKTDPHWDADEENFPVATDAMLARYAKPE